MVAFLDCDRLDLLCSILPPAPRAAMREVSSECRASQLYGKSFALGNGGDDLGFGRATLAGSLAGMRM